MSRKNCRQYPLAFVSESGEAVPESGRIEVRSESPRLAVTLSQEQLGQLALQLGAALRPPARQLPALETLLGEWLQTIALVRVRAGEEDRHAKRLAPLYAETEETLTAAGVTRLLRVLVAGGLAPSSVNKVRSVGKMAIDHAQSATLHHEHGADALCVALALGHAIHGTTHSTYTHVSTDRLKAELSRWALPGDAGSLRQPQPVAAGGAYRHNSGSQPVAAGAPQPE